MAWKTRSFHMALTAACITAALPASAQTVEASKPSTILEALQSAKVVSKLGKDDQGNPLIAARVDNKPFAIVFKDCTNNESCNFVMFYFKLPADPKRTLTMQQLNTWNGRAHFGRAFVDPAGSVFVLHDVNLDKGGMSRALFLDTFQWFTAAAGTIAAMMPAK